MTRDYLQAEEKELRPIKRPHRSLNSSSSQRPALQRLESDESDKGGNNGNKEVVKLEFGTNKPISSQLNSSNSATVTKVDQGYQGLPIDVEDGDDEEDEEGDEDDEDDDYDEGDFEDVEIRTFPMTIKEPESDTIAIKIRQPKKIKPRSQTINNEHRLQRKEHHKLHLVSMIVFGKLINKRINNIKLLEMYEELVPHKIYLELHPNIKNKEHGNMVKSRYFLDGLRHLMELWVQTFRLTTPTGLFKLKWEEIEVENHEISEKLKQIASLMTKKSIFYDLTHFEGNRDVGAWGFVALLRSVHVKSRLVYSIQPPDFTDATPVQKNESDSDEEPKKKKKKPIKKSRSRVPKMSALKPHTLLQKIINTHHKKLNVDEDNSFHIENLMKQNPYLSPYPVFWAEAWNPYSRSWITVDPVNFRILEDIQRISKLEPPMSDERNSLLYAISFDRKGDIKDVTRRYANLYNSKTRKKRITRDLKGNTWYQNMIDSLRSNKEKSDIDLLEDDYFVQRNIKEGMPTSIGDFRNHPIYVLESQLKSNEILYPKTPCGYAYQKTNGKSTTAIPVYHRENVQELRSAGGWFHQGRVVKIGERSLRTRQKKKSKRTQGFKFKDGDEPEEEEADDDNAIRLYGEFQTELFRPEPIKDGIVPKNAYGNIDIYKDSMIPEGGCLVKHKHAVQAAKLLGMDFAPAVIGFDFGYRNSTKPKVGGVIIASDYEEALHLIIDHLEDEDIERQRQKTTTKALKAWKLLFAKLRIVDRLDREHGKIEDLEEEEVDLSAEEEEEEEENEVSDNYEADPDIYGGGGFLPTDLDQDDLRQQEREKRREKWVEKKKDDKDGGFIVNDEAKETAVDEADKADEVNDIDDIDVEMDYNGGYFMDDDERPRFKPRVFQQFNVSDDEFVYNPVDESKPPISRTEDALIEFESKFAKDDKEDNDKGEEVDADIIGEGGLIIEEKSNENPEDTQIIGEGVFLIENESVAKDEVFNEEEISSGTVSEGGFIIEEDIDDKEKIISDGKEEIISDAIDDDFKSVKNSSSNDIGEGGFLLESDSEEIVNVNKLRDNTEHSNSKKSSTLILTDSINIKESCSESTSEDESELDTNEPSSLNNNDNIDNVYSDFEYSDSE